MAVLALTVGYASVIPLYTAQSTQAPPRLAAEQMQSIYKSTHGIGDLERAIETAVRKQFGVNDEA